MAASARRDAGRVAWELSGACLRVRVLGAGRTRACCMLRVPSPRRAGRASRRRSLIDGIYLTAGGYGENGGGGFMAESSQQVGDSGGENSSAHQLPAFSLSGLGFGAALQAASPPRTHIPTLACSCTGLVLADTVLQLPASPHSHPHTHRCSASSHEHSHCTRLDFNQGMRRHANP